MQWEALLLQSNLGTNMYMICLVYRSQYDPTGYWETRLAVLSPFSLQVTMEWAAKRRLEFRKELATTTQHIPGFETLSGCLYQMDWAIVYSKSDRLSTSAYFMSKQPTGNMKCISDQSIQLTVQWLTSIPVENLSTLVSFQQDTFYFEATIGANMPVADALVFQDNQCYIFQVTRNVSGHTISTNGLDQILHKAPELCSQINYVLVVPKDKRRNASISKRETINAEKVVKERRSFQTTKFLVVEYNP